MTKGPSFAAYCHVWFNFASEHEDQRAFHGPHHVPEIHCGVLQRSLHHKAGTSKFSETSATPFWCLWEENIHQERERSSLSCPGVPSHVRQKTLAIRSLFQRKTLENLFTVFTTSQRPVCLPKAQCQHSNTDRFKPMATLPTKQHSWSSFQRLAVEAVEEEGHRKQGCPLG